MRKYKAVNTVLCFLSSQSCGWTFYTLKHGSGSLSARSKWVSFQMFLLDSHEWVNNPHCCRIVAAAMTAYYNSDKLTHKAYVRKGAMPCQKGNREDTGSRLPSIEIIHICITLFNGCPRDCCNQPKISVSQTHTTFTQMCSVLEGWSGANSLLSAEKCCFCLHG